MSDYQDRVAAAVAARGYRAGFTAEQFAARQVAKLAEELGELARCFSHLPGVVRELIREAGAEAREAFDRPRYWDFAELRNPVMAVAELTDVAVVVLAAADAMGFDVLEAAVSKAEADVSRGVRGA